MKNHFNTKKYERIQEANMNMKRYARLFIGAALLIMGIYLIVFAVNGERVASFVGSLFVASAYILAYEGDG